MSADSMATGKLEKCGQTFNCQGAAYIGKILVLDLQQNSGKTAENVLKLILLLIKSGFVERKCVILLLCCVIW